MRVLIAHAFYRTPGGEDRYVRQQVDLLAENHTVRLFDAHNAELRSSRDAAGRMFFTGRGRKKLDRLLASESFDLIHIHNVYPALGASVFQSARRRGLPTVMTVHNFRLRCPNGYRFTEGAICDRCVNGNHLHGVLHECFPTKGQALAYTSASWIDRFIRKITDAVDTFIAPSRFMADRLAMWGFAAERIKLLRNFTPVGEIDRVAGDHGVYAGRLSSEKGLEVLLQALRICGDPPFTILGDGPQRASLEALASSLDLNRVTFAGHVSSAELDRTLSGAQFFVMPSLSDENAPLAVLEAMARGVPVVATNRGGLPELVQEQALIAKAGDANDLARAIDAVIGDPSLRSRASAAVRSFAETELAPHTHRDGLEKIYAETVARRS